jgi:hypothetical protein
MDSQVMPFTNTLAAVITILIPNAWSSALQVGRDYQHAAFIRKHYLNMQRLPATFVPRELAGSCGLLLCAL